MDGYLVIDKPAGISSARVVDIVKRFLPRGTKIGHAGTLDPFATGVLVLLVGKATRRCESLMDLSKEYEATVKLGATTPTDDPDSPETSRPGAAAVPMDVLESSLAAFRGVIDQRPPAFSALKLGGRRAYDLARRGLPTPLKPRKVCVDRIDLVRYEWPAVELAIACGRGTYIRSIARDLGESLGVGGYLTALRRTRAGGFGAADASALADVSSESVGRLLQPM